MNALVAGVGNIFLGDDAFGPEVVREVAKCRLPSGVRVEDFGIRSLHLAYELLEPLDLLVLVDAVARGGPPGSLYLIEPEAEGEVVAADPHGMDLLTVFSLVRGMGGALPRTLLVGCQPADLSEGMGLSLPVRAAVKTAVEWTVELLWKEFEKGREAAVK